ncbi:MAG: hypothetical protein QG661_2594, partial [Actinomycetota bacterium]|nr:hypothetical protein [Actinomycetota bacterium]
MIALLIVVYLHIVIGEMVPKNLSFSIPDRAVLVQWDAVGVTPGRHFVDFGAAIQTQTASRFWPSGPGAPRSTLVLRGLPVSKA